MVSNMIHFKNNLIENFGINYKSEIVLSTNKKSHLALNHELTAHWLLPGSMHEAYGVSDPGTLILDTQPINGVIT